MKAPHMRSCPAFGSRIGSCTCGARFVEHAVTTDQLRALARLLGDRMGAPSLVGYDLVSGLLAAANLIDGSQGPDVHANLTSKTMGRPLNELRKLPLAELLRAMGSR